MSRTRDIAQFLGKTEANNTSNIRLLKVGDAVASDEETLADITVDGGGNVDRVLAGSVSVGDPVILTPENLVKKVGQPFERHEILQTFLMDSDGSGGTPHVAYGYQGYSPQIFYLGFSKIMIVGTSGTTGRGTLWAQIARLDPTGHRVEKIGPLRIMQSSYYTSSTSYGGAMSDSYHAVQGENNRIHVMSGYEYRNSTDLFSRAYIYTVYPEDVEDSENLTILAGTTQTPSNGVPTTSYQKRISRVFGNYTTQAQSSSYYGGNFWWWSPTYNYQMMCTFYTSGDTANITVATNYSTSTGGFDDFNYGMRSWYNAKAEKWLALGNNDHSGSNQLCVFEMKGAGSSTGNYYMNHNTPVIAASETNNQWGRAGVYDSSAGLSIVAYRDNNNVGKLRTINSVSSYSTDPTIGNAYEFTGTLEGDVHLFHDKAVQKNAVLFTDYNATPDKAKIRWFTADSTGTISLEDSTHEMFSDSSWNYSQNYSNTVNKLDDFDTCILQRVTNWAPEFPNRSFPNNSAFYNGLQIFHPERRQATNLTSTSANYLGIAQQAGDSGDTINIKIHGAIDTNQVGLVPNTTYYLNEINGDLEPNTDNGSIRAGYAVAANQLKILTQSGESA